MHTVASSESGTTARPSHCSSSARLRRSQLRTASGPSSWALMTREAISEHDVAYRHGYARSALRAA
jgi:hypothetical protein